MADNVFEFPEAKNESLPEVSVMRCGACDSIAWYLVLPHPDLHCGQLKCTSCGEEFGLWVDMGHQPPDA